MLATLLVALCLPQDPVPGEPAPQDPVDGRAYVGRLVDGAGAPAPGILVELQVDGEVRPARSTADGSFRIPLIPADDVRRARFVVRVWGAPELAFRLQAHLDLAEHPRDVPLGTWTVGPPATLVGRVVDEAGEVQAEGVVRLYGGSIEGGLVHLDLEEAVSIDAASGEFRFERVPAGPVTLYSRPGERSRLVAGSYYGSSSTTSFTVRGGRNTRVSSGTSTARPGPPSASFFFDDESAGESAQLDLVVEPGVETFHELTVRPPPELVIALDPSPIPVRHLQASASLVDGRSAGAQSSLRRGNWSSAEWGKDSPRTFTGLPHDGYSLVFSGDPMQPVPRTFSRDEGPIVVPVRPATGVDLGLSLPEGAPTPRHLTVDARLAAGGGWADPFRVYEGPYAKRLDLRLPPRLWCLDVEALGLPVHRHVERVRGRPAVALALTRAQPLRVRLEPGPDAVPTGDVLVMLERGDPLRLVSQEPFVTLADGCADLGLQIGGQARLRVRFSPWLEVLQPLPDPLPDEIVVRAPRAALVRGRVLLPRDVVPEELRIRPERHHSVALDSEGRFVLGPIAPAERLIQLAVPALGWLDVATADMAPGTNGELVIDLLATYPGDASLTVFGGQERLNVTLRPVAGGPSHQRVTPDGGTVEVRSVRPGEYDVHVEPRSGAWGAAFPAALRVAPGEGTVLELEVELLEREVALVDAQGRPWTRPFLYSTSDRHARVGRPLDDGRWLAQLPLGPVRFWPVPMDRGDSVLVEWAAGEAALEVRLPEEE